MSEQITTAMRKQFSDDYAMLSQQKDSKLGACVRNEPINADDAFYDQVGAADGADITDRHGDTQYASTPHSRRMVRPIPWEWADLIDRADKLRTLKDPQNVYVRTAIAAANRRRDEHIIAAASGTSYTGKAGATEVALPSAQKVAVASAGLTLAKLLATKEILDGNDVDEEIPRYCAISAAQLVALLNVSEIKSADYNTIKALAQGQIDTFLGFKFVRTQLLTLTSSVRYCLAWAEDGLLLATEETRSTFIDALPGKRHSTQVRVEEDMGATRMEEDKVVEIACVEA